MDALLIPSSQMNLYIFPPITLIPRYLNKLGTDRASGLLIAPVWPNQVCSIAAIPDGCSGAVATYAGHTHGPNGPSPSTSPEGPPTFGCVACVRRDLQARGFSEGVVIIIRQSWRGSTEASYSSVWRMWVGWCCGRGTDPILPL